MSISNPCVADLLALARCSGWGLKAVAQNYCSLRFVVNFTGAHCSAQEQHVAALCFVRCRLLCRGRPLEYVFVTAAENARLSSTFEAVGDIHGCSKVPPEGLRGGPTPHVRRRTKDRVLWARSAMHSTQS
jgi:hypothetical protein